MDAVLEWVPYRGRHSTSWSEHSTQYTCRPTGMVVVPEWTQHRSGLTAEVVAVFRMDAVLGLYGTVVLQWAMLFHRGTLTGSLMIFALYNSFWLFAFFWPFFLAAFDPNGQWPNAQKQ